MCIYVMYVYIYISNLSLAGKQTRSNKHPQFHVPFIKVPPDVRIISQFQINLIVIETSRGTNGPTVVGTVLALSSV